MRTAQPHGDLCNCMCPANSNMWHANPQGPRPTAAADEHGGSKPACAKQVSRARVADACLPHHHVLGWEAHTLPSDTSGAHDTLLTPAHHTFHLEPHRACVGPRKPRSTYTRQHCSMYHTHTTVRGVQTAASSNRPACAGAAGEEHIRQRT
jgi:hypothetical protein